MIIQFTVKNFRSIRGEINLQLIKGKGDELEGKNSFAVEANGASNLELVRSAVIYGANAAGKSNIITALAEMRWMVMHSATKLQLNDKLDVEPFMFDSNNRSEPTEFEVDFVSEGNRYQYGFSATKTRIIEEWLFAYPFGRAQTWFHREYDSVIDDYVWTKDSYLTGAKTTWKNATRENSLFLSTAIQLNNSQLKPVFSWFKNILNAVGFNGIDSSYTAQQILENDKKKEILNFLKAGDFDIEDIVVETEEFNLSDLPKDMPDEIKTIMREQLKDAKKLKVKTGHKDSDGSICYLDINDESDGTQRIFSLAAPWIDSLENGLVVFIDELHNSLHPTMVKYLVTLFNNPKTNPKNAQLIFTTHETSILTQDVFRRDQVWFCEKDDAQSTSLFSLSDFKVRKGQENIERNYLSGKYGALPFIKSFDLEALNV